MSTRGKNEGKILWSMGDLKCILFCSMRKRNAARVPSAIWRFPLACIHHLHIIVFGFAFALGAQYATAQKPNASAWLDAPIAPGSDPFSLTQRITIHDETPGHCLAFLSPDRVLWDTAWQDTYTYDIAGQHITTQHDVYQAPTMRRSTRQQMYYDAAGRLADRITDNDSAGTWKPAIREMWYYDVYGQDTMQVQLQWRQLTSGFGWDTTGATRHHIIYNTQNQIAVNTTRAWSASFPMGIWNNASKLEYFFNTQGEWDSLLIYSPFGPVWAAGQRIVAVTWADYALGQRSSYVVQWNQGGWVNGQRVTCSYQGLDSDCLTATYNVGAWDTAARAIALYDAHEHLILAEQYDWQAGQWLKVNGEEHDYTYDSLGHTLELIDRNWDMQVQGYVQGQRRIYRDYFLAAASPSDISASVVAFPNPVTDVLQLQLRGLTGPVQVTVYDMQGRLRVTTAALSQAGLLRIPLDESLASGSYFYHLKMRAGEARGKFLRIH
jgi:hypothetical protein